MFLYMHTTLLLLAMEECGAPGSVAAAFSAAVEVCANSSANHQSWSPHKPTADHAPHSTVEPSLNYTRTENWLNSDVIVFDRT